MVQTRPFCLYQFGGDPFQDYPLIVISSKVLTENHSLVFSLTIYFKALNLIAKIVKIDNFDRWLAHRSLL